MTPLEIRAASAASCILNRLHSWGINTVFAVPGAHVDPFMEIVSADPRFRLVLATHEQGAAYMADGYTRFREKASAVICIGGPGATNLTTAAVTARLDRSPVFYLTGDVPNQLSSAGGFQSSGPLDSNSVAILREALQFSVHVSRVDALPSVLDEAEARLLGRPCGPFHICIPVDVARAPLLMTSGCEAHRLDPSPGTPLAKHLNRVDRCAVFVGEEVSRRADRERLAAICCFHRLPVASTMEAMAVQALLPRELRLGVFGYAGSARARAALLDSRLDLLLVVGASLNERNTALWDSRFFDPGRDIVRLSMSATSATRRIREHVTQDLPAAVEDFASGLQVRDSETQADWLAGLLDFPDVAQCVHGVAAADGSPLPMPLVLDTMRREMPGDATLFVDSGEHRLHAGLFWECRGAGNFFTAARTAPMGWAIAAAIGASFAPDSGTLWVLTGDGCMLMHGMELAVAARHQRRIVILLSSNGSYGRIAMRFSDHPAAHRDAISQLPDVDWAGFARSLGLQSRVATTIVELTGAIREAASGSGPWLIEILTRAGDPSPVPEANFSSASRDFDSSAIFTGDSVCHV